MAKSANDFFLALSFIRPSVVLENKNIPRRPIRFYDYEVESNFYSHILSSHFKKHCVFMIFMLFIPVFTFPLSN